jgi:threonine/homoserine/homoserine lactone efflux protein
LVSLAPPISDPPIVLLILLLLDQIPAQFLRIISLAGGLFVLYLAWKLWKQWQAGTRSSHESQADTSGMLGIVALFHQARRLGPTVVRGLTLVSTLILIAFGVFLLWQGMSLFTKG